MDLNSLRDTVSNLTLYDIKAGVRKVQNAVMNYTDMEAKVREATNNEPWGASSTLMQEIANGTFNYQQLNEIMPMIYRRFTEKSAEEWRQIYKALQLLEFLIKNGSERVIDDARSHLTLLKMLRQFHFIDQNGKDQGINIRNRAKELADLLSDVERIRAERKKARANKQKYTGVEGGSSFAGGSSSRYGGFGSESGGHADGSFGGYSGGVYGDGGGFSGGSGSSDFQDSSRRSERFEEYDEFDEGERPAPAAETPRAKRTTERVGVKKTTPSSPPKKKEPVVDLFSFDDPAPAPSTAASILPPSGGSNMAVLGSAPEEDEFDDFQSATPSTQTAQPTFGNPIAPLAAPAALPAQFAAPKPVSAPQQATLTNMVGLSSISPAPSSTATTTPNYSAFSSPISPANQPPKPTGYQAATPNYFQSIQSGGSSQQATPSAAGFGGQKPASAAPAAKSGAGGGDAFGALWSQASAGIKKTGSSGPSVAMGQLAKEKSAAGIWGAPAASPAGQINQPPAGSSAGGSGSLDDLLG